VIEMFDYEFLNCFDAVRLAKRGDRTIWPFDEMAVFIRTNSISAKYTRPTVLD
jgi:hypothetical protein